MKGSAAVSRVKVSADGHGVVSHAGAGMLREVADLAARSAQVTAALADTYGGPWTHVPGAVFADLVAAVADGADCVDGVARLWGDRVHAFGGGRLDGHAVAVGLMKPSTPPICRGFGPPEPMPGARARAAGAAPHHEGGGWTGNGLDATITIDDSDNKENAAATWKKTFGFHPLLVFFWTAPTSPPGKRWPGCCERATPAVTPPPTTSACWIRQWRRCRRPTGPTPITPTPHRCRSARFRRRATYGFAGRPAGNRGWGSLCGHRCGGAPGRRTMLNNTPTVRYPAITADGGIRDGAWVAEATDLVGLWRPGRPAPG